MSFFSTKPQSKTGSSALGASGSIFIKLIVHLMRSIRFLALVLIAQVFAIFHFGLGLMFRVVMTLRVASHHKKLERFADELESTLIQAGVASTSAPVQALAHARSETSVARVRSLIWERWKGESLSDTKRSLALLIAGPVQGSLDQAAKSLQDENLKLRLENLQWSIALKGYLNLGVHIEREGCRRARFLDRFSFFSGTN